MINDIPYDTTTHSNPWLMNRNNSEAIIGPEGEPLIADYIWNKSGIDRENLVLWVFNYYRKLGFPFPKLSDIELNKEFKRLIDKDPDDIINENGEFKNSSSLGNNIYRHFLGKEYFSAKGEKKTKSLYEVFYDDELLMKVLKNRMGYCFSTEDGEERAYCFTMSDKMVLQGIRSSAYGYNVSLFKPVAAKYLYKYYSKKKIFDLSAGWGARALAAMSLNIEYYGVDPLTANGINKMMKFFDGKGFVVDGCSEDKDIYDYIPVVDCIMSSPPFYNLEIYSDSENQSINKYKEYGEWIEKYWGKTVENCMRILEEGGYFIFVAKNKVGKYNLAEDMKNICEKDNLLKLEKMTNIRTSNSHLSGKKNTGKISKNTELVYIWRKK